MAYDPLSNPLNHIEWAFGALECTHIVSFAVGVGTIALVDLRLLSTGLKSMPAERMGRDLSLWTLGGLALALTSGLLLFSTDPERYAANGAFRFKVVCLAIALIYQYTLHGRATRPGTSPGLQAAAGAVSLLLWIPVIFGGLFYAFT